MYDYLIVGAGLFGAIFANEANKRCRKCLVINKRNSEHWRNLVLFIFNFDEKRGKF